MDTISLLIELEALKKKMDNAEAFLEELVEYIFKTCKDDDYITPEVICRKLYKYGFIDKRDGEWVADIPQTERSACDTCYVYNRGIPCGVDSGVCKQEVADTPQTEEDRLREQCRAFIDMVEITKGAE